MSSGLQPGSASVGAKLRDSLLAILATEQSLEEIFREFVEVLNRLVRCDRCVLYRVQGGVPELVCGVGHNGESALASCPAEPLLIPDAQRSTVVPQGLHSYLLMPIHTRGKLRGALELGACAPHTFTEQHVGLLETAVQILGVVMTQEELESRLAEVSREREPQARRTKVFAEILALWPQHMEMDQVAALLAEGLEAHCDIFLWDEPSQHLVMGASTVVDTSADVVTLPLHKGIVGQAAAFKAVINVTDVRTDARYVLRVASTCSELAVPMVDSSGALLGVVNVESTRPAAFSGEDAELLAGMARFLALWMESRLREKRQSAARQEAMTMAQDVCHTVDELTRVREQARSLESRLARAEQLSALGHLVAGAARELNNPLTVMQGYAEMLMEQPLPPAVVQRLKTIQAQSRHAASIVAGLLQLSRATPRSEDAGEAPKQKSCDLAEVMQEVVAACAQDLATRNVVLTVRADPTLFVPAEPREIARMLAQLLKNAEAAVRQADRKEICVSSQRIGDRAELSVADTGTGIAAEALPQIFEPFFTTNPGFGAGLGLYLCTGIVKACGGTIDAANRPEGGALFTVILPALADAQHPAQAGGTALVLTEEEHTRSLWEETLHAENWQAIAASTPEEALQKLDRNHFDLVLTDVPYPQQEGLALRAGVKERGDRVPLLVVTAQHLDTTTRTLLERSGCLLLGKPFRIGELRQILHLSRAQVA